MAQPIVDLNHLELVKRFSGSSRSFTVIRKDAGLYCGPRLRKGEVFAYVGLPQNLKDLKDLAVILFPLSRPVPGAPW